MVATDYSGCNDSGLLTASTPDLQGTFATAVTTGSYDDWHGGGGISATGEAGLYVSAANVENTDPGECNAGFLRPDALLHTVVVSDEPDQSPETWDAYVADLVAKKGSSSLVKMSAVAGDYPSGCATASAGVGYYEAASATGGAFASICSDWASTVDVLAEASASQSSFPLTYTPDPDTIVVWVDGAEQSSGWAWDSSTNTVVFDASVGGGSTVEIDYAAVGTCD